VKERERVSMDEVEAEDAVALPNKEVMSLLDVNANVDLGLDLAAPVDLAVAANLNVAAPIEASASANVLSPDAQSVSVAHQSGSIDQSISGKAEAIAPQHADVTQNSNPVESGGGAVAGTTPPSGPDGVQVPADPSTAGAATGAGNAVEGAAGGATGGATDAVGGATGGATDAVGGAAGGAAGAVGGATSGAGDAVSGATGGVDNLLNGGSLLDANVNIHANANLAAPIDGAVAANANVAAPIDASVSANVGSPGAISEAAAEQEVNISQHLDGVTAHAEATQDASVDQK
jgi:hypothetical protein